ALEAFTASKDPHAGLETAWTHLGDVCSGLQDFPGARKAYEQSLTAFPRGRSADRARYGLGRTLASQGEGVRALQVLHEVAEHGGSEWVDRAWLQIGAIEQIAGHWEKVLGAMAALEQAAPGSPLRAEARFRRAQALARLSRSAEAEELLRPLAGDPSGSF